MHLCLSDHFLCSPAVDQKLADLRLFAGSHVSSDICHSVVVVLCVCMCVHV